jgi:hypothetical protein
VAFGVTEKVSVGNGGTVEVTVAGSPVTVICGRTLTVMGSAETVPETFEHDNVKFVSATRFPVLYVTVFPASVAALPFTVQLVAPVTVPESVVPVL